ncbi:MAG: ImmA/IrrE family metallo-endopeptidase [Ignavibacteriaceae bacterium]|nr:ImmA/IrrE family metallo-endopeptidase [Ignavibacteriaceae bacterium]
MKEKLPVNKDIMSWARTSIGLTIEEVAGKFHKSEKEIEAWENGTASPTFVQLERLAFEIYKRPIAVFFFPSVPKEETPKTEFRSLPETIINELPHEIVKLYRRAKLFQLNLEELFEGNNPVERLFLDRFSFTAQTNIISLTSDIRRELKVSIDEQSKWNSTEVAFKNWRSVFEANGIFIFKDAFKNDGYSGFCLYDNKYPVIYVNNSMPDSRQVFTLFHELAHLLFKSGGIDFRSNELTKTFEGYHRNIEVNCNKFANEFLVPNATFDSFQLTVAESQFQKLANFFSVSREVILRNYLERGLVNKSYYEEMTAKWIKQARDKKEGSDGGSYYYNRKAYLGDRYISLVYGKYYQNKITLDNVADYLVIKSKNLPTFEHLVMEGGKRK